MRAYYGLEQISAAERRNQAHERECDSGARLRIACEVSGVSRQQSGTHRSDLEAGIARLRRQQESPSFRAGEDCFKSRVTSRSASQGRCTQIRHAVRRPRDSGRCRTT